MFVSRLYKVHLDNELVQGFPGDAFVFYRLNYLCHKRTSLSWHQEYKYITPYKSFMRGEERAFLGTRSPPVLQEASLLNLDVSLWVFPQIVFVPEGSNHSFAAFGFSRTLREIAATSLRTMSLFSYRVFIFICIAEFPGR